MKKNITLSVQEVAREEKSPTSALSVSPSSTLNSSTQTLSNVYLPHSSSPSESWVGPHRDGLRARDIAGGSSRDVAASGICGDPFSTRARHRQGCPRRLVPVPGQAASLPGRPWHHRYEVFGQRVGCWEEGWLGHWFYSRLFFSPLLVKWVLGDDIWGLIYFSSFFSIFKYFFSFVCLFLFFILLASLSFCFPFIYTYSVPPFCILYYHWLLFLCLLLSETPQSPFSSPPPFPPPTLLFFCGVFLKSYSFDIFYISRHFCFHTYIFFPFSLSFFLGGEVQFYTFTALTFFLSLVGLLIFFS